MGVRVRLFGSKRLRMGVLVMAAVVLGTPLAYRGMVELRKPSTSLRFTDVALEAGLQDRGNRGRAVVAADFNGDGWMDFYFGNPGGTSRIFYSNGPGPDGTITFRPGPILLDGPEAFAFGAAAADYDNDGNPDIFVAAGGLDTVMTQIGAPNHLFHNNGDGTFTDVAEQVGVNGHLNKDTGQLEFVASVQGSWGDYDRDGCLDLYVSNQNDYGNSLFHNNCDGTFTDVTKPAGLDIDTRSMAATWGDFNDDGWPDLLVPHARGGHHSLYLNNRNGTFTRISPNVLASPWASWASAAADVDQDGKLDAFGFAAHGVRDTKLSQRLRDLFTSVVGMVQPSYLIKDIDQDYEGLYVNQGVGKNGLDFTDEGGSSGWSPKGARTAASMGNQVGDLNNDGFPEIYLGAGSPVQADRDRLYENVTQFGGPTRFHDVSYLVDTPAPDDPNFKLSGPIPAQVFGLRTICGDQRYEALPGGPASDPRYSFGCATLAATPNDPKYVEGTYAGMNYKAPYPYRGHGTIFVDYNRDNKIDIMAVKGGPLTMPWTIEPNRLWRNDTPNVGALLTLKLVGRLSNRDGSGARIVAHPSLGGKEQPARYVDVQSQSGFGASRWGETYIGLGQADKATLEIHWPSGVVQVLRDVAVNQRLTVNEADAIVFGDSFDQAIVPALWETRKGQWTWMGRQAESCGGTLASREGTFAGSDGEIVAKLTIDKTGAAGLVARLGGSGGGIAALVTPRGLQVGPLDQIHQVAPTDIGPVEPGRMVLLRMKLHGESVQVQADEGQPVAVQDATPATGPVGLMVEDGCARFDYIAVTR